MNTAPIFGSTFEELNWVREACGYDANCEIVTNFHSMRLNSLATAKQTIQV
jgi:hypothetical protein